MSEAIVEVIKTYPGWTMFCIIVIVLSIANGVESFLDNISKRNKK